MDIDQMAEDITNLVVKDMRDNFDPIDEWYLSAAPESRKLLKSSLHEVVAEYLEAHV